MKPEDLCYPFSWEERRPVFKDRVFFIPDYYHEHKKELFPCFEECFGNKNPVHLEYCSGNGEWIINRARENPGMNWIAVELKFNRVQKIYYQMLNYKIENLLIVAGEGLTFSREYLADSSIDAVYVNFPDPWPKSRHAKHRLIQESFVNELRRTVKQEGKVTIVTDDAPYKEQVTQEMAGWKEVEDQHVNYGSSFFERLWVSLDRNIYHLSYANS